ncbi:unnamed protein product [Calicophoron daubneyi]|uniref:Uncharacterized protein n=1 Tax=Calicophoron daubneyi TaxID=300641 RepID=A0AAV2TB99_CALDB
MKRQRFSDKIRNCKRLFYDPETKTCLGRDAKNWCLLLIYYAVAYSFLAAFFVGMISVYLYGYVQNTVPTLSGKHSILSGEPGLALTPIPSTKHRFVHVQATSINERYVNDSSTMLSAYTDKETKHCTESIPSTFPRDPCFFNTSILGECADPKSAASNKRPCFYIKLNRIYGWLPDIEGNSTEKVISIRCKGQNLLDTYLLGKPKYFPEAIYMDNQPCAQMDTKYYPFINQMNEKKQNIFQNPLVAVTFPEAHKNTIIMVECYPMGVKNAGKNSTFEICIDE